MMAEIAAGPKKGKRDLCRSALQLLEWELVYDLPDSVRTPLDCVLWLISVAKEGFVDWLDKKGRRR